MESPNEPTVASSGIRAKQRADPLRPRAASEPTVASRGIRAKQRAVALRRALTELTGRSHGVVARRQLVAMGFSSDAIRRLVDSGWLHPVARGVYHVGHPIPTLLGWHMAATLAFGKRTAVSHRPAVALDGLLEDRGAAIEVTTSSGDSGWHGGVLVHESRRLTAADVTRIHGIAVVALEWAVVDVAGSCGEEEFTRLFNAIDRRRLVDPLPSRGSFDAGARAALASAGSSTSTPRLHPRSLSSRTSSSSSSWGPMGSRRPSRRARRCRTACSASTSAGRTSASWWRSTAVSGTPSRPPGARITSATSGSASRAGSRFATRTASSPRRRSSSRPTSRTRCGHPRRRSSTDVANMIRPTGPPLTYSPTAPRAAPSSPRCPARACTG
jgi:hypothetical protein